VNIYLYKTACLMLVSRGLHFLAFQTHFNSFIETRKAWSEYYYILMWSQPFSMAKQCGHNHSAWQTNVVTSIQHDKLLWSKQYGHSHSAWQTILL